MSLEKEGFTSPYLFASQYGELMYKPKHLWKILDVRLDIVLQLYIREEHRILDGPILTSTFGYEREVNAPMNSKLQHPPPPSLFRATQGIWLSSVSVGQEIWILPGWGGEFWAEVPSPSNGIYFTTEVFKA